MEDGRGARGPWYDATGDELALRLNGTANHLWTMDVQRLERYERYNKLYGGSRLIAMRPWESPTDTIALWNKNRAIEDALRLNVVKAAIDTITSKVGKLRTRPTYATEGGDWKLRQRAKGLQRFTDGAYHQSDAYELAPMVFRDAMICGTGVMYAYAQGRRICAERVPPWELFTDIADALYGTPRCIYRIKWVSVDKVRELYGIEPQDVRPGSSDGSEQNDDTPAGYVRMVEAWCLPLRAEGYDGGNDDDPAGGMHVLLAGDVMVGEPEAYPHHEFPFTFFHWSPPVQGFWGDSAVREVVGLQVEINRLIQSVQAAMKKCGVPWIIKLDDVVVTPQKLTNEVAQVINIDAKLVGAKSLDEAIRVQTFQSVHPQVIGHIWQLYAKAFEILGSNQLAASATAPPGLESGRALEQLAEEHSERFLTVSRAYERMLGKGLSAQFRRVAKEVDERLKANGHSEGFVITAPDSNATIKIKWSDVQMDEDSFLVQVFPTSVLPTTPAARIQEVQRLSDAGWIQPDEARRLLDFPDLRNENDLVAADGDLLEWQLDQMLGGGKPMQPMPYQNLARALVRSQQAAMRAQVDGVPESHIDEVRDFMALVEAMMAPPAPPPATPAAPGTLGPSAVPPAPPPGAPGEAPAAPMPGM